MTDTEVNLGRIARALERIADSLAQFAAPSRVIVAPEDEPLQRDLRTNADQPNL